MTIDYSFSRVAVARKVMQVCSRGAEQMCRRFAIVIKSNPGKSDTDKVFVGVRPVNTSREPVHVPATSPFLNILAATPGSQTLRSID